MLIEGLKARKTQAMWAGVSFRPRRWTGCKFMFGGNLETGSFYSCTVQEAFGYDLYASAQAKDKTE